MSRRVGLSACLMLALSLVFGGLALAQENQAPVVESAWVEPDLATFGDTVTFYATVSDPDGLQDIGSVWVAYGMMPLWQMNEVDQGSYACSWTVPETGFVPPVGKYSFDVVAVDQSGALSERFAVELEITDRDPRIPQLLWPKDGSYVGCRRPLLFGWSVVPFAVGYRLEITGPDGDVIGTELEGHFNVSGILPKVLRRLPDGEFHWKVRALFAGGQGGWSDEWTFTKDCVHGPHLTINGVITRIDSDKKVFLLAVKGKGERPGIDGETGRRFVPVQVTDETEIYKDDEQISFDDLEVGDVVSVFGYFQRGEEDQAARKGLFVAEKIFVRGHMPEWERLYGQIRQISYERRTFLLFVPDQTAPEGGPVLVKVADDAKITRGDEDIRFEDLKEGDLALCVGQYRQGSDGQRVVFWAVRVAVRQGQIDFIKADGTITEIYSDRQAFQLEIPKFQDPETGEFLRVLVVVSERTKLYRGENPIFFDDLKVGDEAHVEGKFDRQGNIPVIYAALVVVREPQQGQSTVE